MKLKELISTLEHEPHAMEDVDITGITCDSRNVQKGWLFAAIEGEKMNGHEFIEDAVNNGAACVLTSHVVEGIDVPQLVVDDNMVRAGLATLSHAFYNAPCTRLTMVGVTGTNGKTTLCWLVESILEEAGLTTGVLGTINRRYLGKSFKADNTTPPSPELCAYLDEMAEGGVSHCVMEVSSHGLKQGRVEGCTFRTAVFTNLSHEHLDYHRTMEEYFEAKKTLFNELLNPDDGVAVINTDDSWGKLLKKETPRSLGFSLKGETDICPEKFSLNTDGIEATLHSPLGTVEVSSTLVGDFNLQNIMAAVGVGCALNIDAATIERGIKRVTNVPGRLERIGGKDAGFQTYVDYAHTPDALERVLRSLRAISDARIITVFGCGGDRDRTKRPVMGEVVTRLSNVSIMTSDNPRNENPLEIIDDIIAGVKGVKRLSAGDEINTDGYMVIADRAEAIQRAVALARTNDVVLLAGKGHEDYQLVGGETLPFDDRLVLKEAIKGL